MSPGTQIILQIAGATVLLLWGLNMLRHSAAKLLSWRLKRLAARAGGGGLGAFGAGAVMGGLLQSSHRRHFHRRFHGVTTLYFHGSRSGAGVGSRCRRYAGRAIVGIQPAGATSFAVYWLPI